MSKWIVGLALGVGLVFAGGSVASAKRVVKRKSKGVKMTCFASTKRCTFKNKRRKRMKCRYTLRYKLRKFKRKHRTKRGTIRLRPRQRKTVKFHYGRFKVKKLFYGTLKCRRW